MADKTADAEPPKCGVCGEPMPPGEEMFNYHGYSGPCPKPPLPRQPAEPVAREWIADNDDTITPMGATSPFPGLDAEVAEHNILARAYFALRGEVEAAGQREKEHFAIAISLGLRAEAAEAELRTVDQAFGNPLALDDCKTRADKISKMFRAREAAEARCAELVKALRTHGSHAASCSWRNGEITCDCGLNAALAGKESGGF